MSCEPLAFFGGTASKAFAVSRPGQQDQLQKLWIFWSIRKLAALWKGRGGHQETRKYRRIKDLGCCNVRCGCSVASLDWWDSNRSSSWWGWTCFSKGRGRTAVRTGQQSASRRLKFAHPLSFPLLPSVAEASALQSFNASIRAAFLQKGTEMGWLDNPLNLVAFAPSLLSVPCSLVEGRNRFSCCPFCVLMEREESELQQMHLQLGLISNCSSLGWITHL